LNKLPVHVVEAETVNCFKRRLDKINVRVGTFKATAYTARHHQSQSQRTVKSWLSSSEQLRSRWARNLWPKLLTLW